MEKEEILARSREENGGKDFYGQEVEKQGNGAAGIAMAALATAFFLIPLAAGGGMNWGLYAIVFCRPAVLAWAKWAKLREGRQLSLALACTAGVALFSICHVYVLLGGE